MNFEPNNKLNQFAEDNSLYISQSFLTNSGRYLRDDLPKDKVYVETIVKSGSEVIFLSYTEYNYTDDQLLQIIKGILNQKQRENKLNQLFNI